MASKVIHPSAICCFSLLLLLVFLCVGGVSAGSPKPRFRLIDALTRKGYTNMATLLDMALPEILETSYPTASAGLSSLTLFVPMDKYFTPANLYPYYYLYQWTHYADPHLTLLRYHTVPFKIDQNTLESSPPYSKIPTLLHDLPLVITSSTAADYDDSGSGSGHVSIDSVEIVDWNLYSDTDIIVHGIKGFFNTGYTVMHPSPEGPTLRPDNIIRQVTSEQPLMYWW